MIQASTSLARDFLPSQNQKPKKVNQKNVTYKLTSSELHILKNLKTKIVPIDKILEKNIGIFDSISQTDLQSSPDIRKYIFNHSSCINIKYTYQLPKGVVLAEVQTAHEQKN